MEWNREQWQAITHKTGPVLVVAGPGSGKTAVIVNHVKFLLKEGVDGREILVLTFTRAAAAEMAERFGHLVPEESAVTFGTFHAVCFHILKEECGYKSEDLLTKEDKRRLLKEVLFEQKRLQANGEAQIERLLTQIGRYKSGLGREELEADPRFFPIYCAYQKKLRMLKRLDFDDMLEQCLALFSKYEQVRERWKRRFRYILVDEYQDLNHLQTAWVRLLAGADGNVFAVGDEDQSIYRFRGAEPSGMLAFEKQYPKAGRILLSVNYRSVPEILAPAAKLIAKNTDRFSKKIRAARAGCEGAIRVRCYEDVEEEQEAIVQDILKLRREGVAFTDIAVLYRSIAGARGLMRACSEQQIPFVCKEIPEEARGDWAVRDMESYWNLAQGKRWRRADLLRILNRPDRGLPSTGLYREWIEPAEWLEQFRGVDGYEEKARELYGYIQHIGKMDRYAAATYIWHRVGYEGFVKAFCHKKQVSEAPIRRQVMAWRDGEVLDREKVTEGVSLMTMHAAKGLEFSAVFLPQLNEGVIPHSRALSKEELEEERRLMYVAVTRAKDRLYLSWVKRRYRHHPPASRFLKEMGLSWPSVPSLRPDRNAPSKKTSA